jgi:hypothetical protein
LRQPSRGSCDLGAQARNERIRELRPRRERELLAPLKEPADGREIVDGDGGHVPVVHRTGASDGRGPCGDGGLVAPPAPVLLTDHEGAGRDVPQSLRAGERYGKFCPEFECRQRYMERRLYQDDYRRENLKRKRTIYPLRDRAKDFRLPKAKRDEAKRNHENALKEFDKWNRKNAPHGLKGKRK